MQRLTLDQPIPDSLAREHRRARQFRRIPPRPPGGGRPGGAARLARAAAGDRRHLRSAPGAPLQARRAAVPPDQPRPARAAVRPCRRRRDAGVRVRRRSCAATSAEDFVAGCSASRSAPRAWSPATISPSARAAAAMSRCCATLGAAAGIVAEDGRAGAARRRARSRRAASARRCMAGDTGRATHLLTRAFAIEGVVAARRQARPRARLSDRQPRARRLSAARVRHLRRARDAGGRAASIRASPASASARRSTRRRSCSRRICSTSTATFTAGRSRSRSTPIIRAGEAKFDGIEPLIAHMQGRRGEGAAPARRSTKSPNLQSDRADR